MGSPAIIALDVGGTTGIAMQMPDNNLLTCTASSMEEMISVLKQFPWNYIVVENFLADNRVDKHGLHTIRLVGAACAYGIIFDIPVHVQHPQFRYSSRMEMEKVMKNRVCVVHEKDAMSHLLAFREKTLPRLKI